MSVGMAPYPMRGSVSSNKDDITNSFGTNMLDKDELYPEWLSVSDHLTESKLYSSFTRIPSKNSRKELRQQRRDTKMTRSQTQEESGQTLGSSSQAPSRRSKKMERAMRRWAWVHEKDTDVIKEPCITSTKVIRWSGKQPEWPSVLRRMKLRTNQIKHDRSYKRSDFDYLHNLGTEVEACLSDDGSDDNELSNGNAKSTTKSTTKSSEAKWDWADEDRKYRPKTLYVGNDWYQVLR